MNQPKIYIVDDNEDMLEYFSELLHAEFTIETFAHAEPVLEKLDQKEQPALIITDYRMPGLNGLELVAEVNNRNPICLPIIILSGAADKEMAIKALQLGVFAIIEKPTNRIELLHTARHAIAYHQSYRLNTILIAEFSDLTEDMTKLLETYHDRMARAENLLFTSAKDKKISRDESKKILDNLSTGRELEKRIQKSKDSIKMLEHEHVFLKEILSSIKQQPSSKAS